MSSSSNPVATYNIFRTFYPPDKTATTRGGYFLMFAHSGVDKVQGGSGSVMAMRQRKRRRTKSMVPRFYFANGFRLARTRK